MGQIGLGWMLDRDKDLARHQGGSPGVSVSLIIHAGSGQACAALTNRQVPIEPVCARVIRALTGAGE